MKNEKIGLLLFSTVIACLLTWNLQTQMMLVKSQRALVLCQQELGQSKERERLSQAAQEYTMLYIEDGESLLRKQLAKAIDERKAAISRFESQTQALESSRFENTVLRDYYRRSTGTEVGVIKKVNIEATRYTNAEGGRPSSSPNYGKTASGVMASRGTAAAPRSIPFGSTVMILDNTILNDQDGILKVQDRGGAIINKGDGVCIDIWIPEAEKQKAFQFGRRKLEGYIIIPKGK